MTEPKKKGLLDQMDELEARRKDKGRKEKRSKDEDDLDLDRIS